VEFVSCCFQ